MIAADQRLLLYSEVAERLRVTTRTVSKLVSEGRLTAMSFGHHTKRIAELDLLAFQNKSRTLDRRPR